MIFNKKSKLARTYHNVKKTVFNQVSDSSKQKKRSITSRRSNNSNTSKQLILLNYFATFALVGLVGGTLLVLIFLAIISRDLPNPNRLLERSYELSTKFFDRNGEPIFEVYGEKNRTLVTLDQISEHVQHATMAIEDADFYAHSGISIRGMARAVKNMVQGGSTQSGSTITQQVIKNTLLTPEQTILRKIREIILTLQLENRYSKDEILQMYLNESPYGGQNYGVFTASKTYFGKHPKDLTLAESAYLSGLPQSPSVYAQFGTNPELGLERKNTVLRLMHENGWLGKDGNRYFISDEEYNQAINQELVFQPSNTPFKAPHFVFYTKKFLIDMFGEDVVEQGGLQVKTTLDLGLQENAQTIVAEEIEKSEKLNVNNGALVALDPKTGQVLAMVGSKGYFDSSYPEDCISGGTGEGSCLFEPQLNVTLANRQPGSAIKPITFATMLKQGYTASFPFLDVPTRFPGSSNEKPYEPVNYDGTFKGPISLRKSLGNSLNIPAVKALGIVGIDSMVDLAEEMGITTFTDRQRYGLALTLGGGETKLLELTGAYGAFANKGKVYPPIPVLEVKDSQGNILYQWRDNGGKRVLSEEEAFLIADILSDDGARSATFGAGSLLNVPGYQVAVKTGTTDDKRDNYWMSFTPSVVLGVWVGNNNNDAMNPYVASGITGATPIGNRFMKEYLAMYFKDKPEKFEPTDKLQKINVDTLTGGLPFQDNSTRPEWFIKGTEPTSVSDWYQRLEICKEDGLLANDSCRDADKTDEKTYIGIKAELSQWQAYVDKWISESYSGEDKYFPPQSRTCLEFDGDDVKESDKVCVNILNYDDGDKVPLDFRLSAEVSSGKEIKEVRVYMDGKQITSDGSEPYGYNFELNGGSIGKHEFSVVAENESGNKAEEKITLDVVGYVLD